MKWEAIISAVCSAQMRGCLSMAWLIVAVSVPVLPVKPMCHQMAYISSVVSSMYCLMIMALFEPCPRGILSSTV